MSFVVAKISLCRLDNFDSTKQKSKALKHYTLRPPGTRFFRIDAGGSLRPGTHYHAGDSEPVVQQLRRDHEYSQVRGEVEKGKRTPQQRFGRGKGHHGKNIGRQMLTGIAHALRGLAPRRGAAG